MKKILLLLGCFLILSCKSSSKNDFPRNIQINEKVFHWFYFGEGKINKADSISSVPVLPLKPWTEAYRLSSMNAKAFSEKGTAFGTVNRLGVIIFEDKAFDLISSRDFFDSKTAGNLVFYNDVPFIHIYRSTFFNDKQNRKALHSFLIQLDENQKLFYPVLNVENLGFDESTEITGLIFDGKSWTGEAKRIKPEDGKIDFEYFNFQAKEDLTQINPENGNDSVFVTDFDMEKFRDAYKNQNYSKAPERIRRLFKSLPSDLGFTFTLWTTGGHFPRSYEKTGSAEKEMLQAAALLSETYCASLFSDGTFYINGSLSKRGMINEGKTVALRLPSLPEGFVYSGFVISGETLYASWEENSFYEIGRSGFIQLDLGSILYK